MAKITQPIILNEVVGGKTAEKVVRKCDLIKSHTARRTGATNMLKMGYSLSEIMKVTGHTTEKSLLNYMKISKEENADLMIAKKIS